MEITKHKPLLIGLGIGLVAGTMFGFIFTRCAMQTENFSVQIIGQTAAIRLNNRTGQAWMFSGSVGQREKGWQPIVEGKTMQGGEP